MTTKEKSLDIFYKYYQSSHTNWNQAKECALIAVNEIIELHKGMFMAERENQNESYWQEVKQEIEAL